MNKKAKELFEEKLQEILLKVCGEAESNEAVESHATVEFSLKDLQDIIFDVLEVEETDTQYEYLSTLATRVDNWLTKIDEK